MRNKIFAILIPLLLVCLGASAQIGEHRSELSIGVTGGMSMNSIDFDPTIKQKSLMAFTGGIAMRYTCEKYFSTVCALQIELNYTQLGWKEDISSRAGEPLPDKYTRKINYIQLPMFARLGWGKEQRGLMFYILAGPQIGYCIGDTSERSAEWTINEEGNPDRPNNMYEQYDLKIKNKIDYGIAAGLGLELNTKIGHFTLEGRYYYGLADIFGNSKKDVFARSANGTIFAKIGYFINIKSNN